MSSDKLKKCLKEGENAGERHKGLKKITQSKEKTNDHITKALRNFELMNTLHQLGFSDWSASAAFYTLYHGLLALLAQRGYESRNQSCTFALVEEWIKNKELTYIKVEDIQEIFEKDVVEDIEHSDKILDIRERMQYSTRTSLSEEEFIALKKRTKELLDKIRLEVESTMEM